MDTERRAERAERERDALETDNRELRSVLEEFDWYHTSTDSTYRDTEFAGRVRVALSGGTDKDPRTSYKRMYDALRMIAEFNPVNTGPSSLHAVQGVARTALDADAEPT